jgi:alkylation response protein AidB-like acyl-CoA dehydrogenase
MNFEFSEDSRLLRDQARRFLAERCTTKHVRQVLEGEAPFLRELWREIAGMGWLGAAIPEDYEGAGLGYEALCVLRPVRGAWPGAGTGAVHLDRVPCRRGDPGGRVGAAETRPPAPHRAR